jgi:hypothetical protein
MIPAEPQNPLPEEDVERARELLAGTQAESLVVHLGAPVPVA